MSALDTDSVKRLFHCIASLENEDECRLFFEDLCTIKELLDMAQRLDAAVLLDKRENYQTINRAVGISTATISRVKRCIDYGPGGYRIVLDRLKAEEGDE